jgi:hypothetical protein
MATKIRPIVFKIDEPEGFVMNASNATITVSSGYLSWQGPAYPEGYDGQGKQFIVVNNNSNEHVIAVNGLLYCTTIDGGGPVAIAKADILTSSTGTVMANQAPVALGYGAYLCIPVEKVGGGKPTEAELQEYAANLTITILDP